MNRRAFLRTTGAAGVASGIGVWPRASEADPPLETKRLRLIRGRSLCWAPQYIADDLLRAEGFTDVTYADFGPVAEAVSTMLSRGDADFSMNFVGPNLVRVDQGDPVVFLAGMHVGCFEVFGNERVRRISDLKGKTVPVSVLHGTEYAFFASIAAYVGLDPRKDINWVIHNADEGARLFADGKVDAFIGFPPQPQELRARGVGRVIVNSSADRPWSQYFCCLITANRDFVRRNPGATKRALRGLLKAADLCATDPDRAAHALVERKFAPRYDLARQVMRELPYDKWRHYDPEDTLRFYALRLHEAGMIRSRPQKILAESTDWRFLNELKKELKG